MRRFLLVLLVLWLPLQFAWGAVATLCTHETASTVSHLGHHTHQHAGKTAPAHDESAPDKKSTLAGEDLDCSYCHIGCAQPLMSALPQSLSLCMREHYADAVTQAHSPHVPGLIERPKWTLAA